MTLSPKDGKARLRMERLAARDALTPAARAAGVEAMVWHADGIGDVAGKVLSGFQPIRSEPDIRPLMEWFRARGARLCLPVVLDRETIVFRAFPADAALVATGFGTTGPDDTFPECDPQIMLVPLSAFDGAGHRIGYGAGHYDRAIARLTGLGRRPRLIGIAFACQEVASVPFEPHDIPLDAILTERGLRLLQGGSTGNETFVSG